MCLSISRSLSLSVSLSLSLSHHVYFFSTWLINKSVNSPIMHNCWFKIMIKLTVFACIEEVSCSKLVRNIQECKAGSSSAEDCIGGKDCIRGKRKLDETCQPIERVSGEYQEYQRSSSSCLPHFLQNVLINNIWGKVLGSNWMPSKNFWVTESHLKRSW